MMQKIQKIARYFIEGKLLGVLHEKVCLFFIPEIIGSLSLLFYRILYYPRLKILGVTCWGSVVISKSPDSMISIGHHVRVGSHFARAGIALYSKCKITAYAASKIIIGDRVALSGTSITCRTTSIEIGEGTIIAPNVIIVDSDFHAPWPPENRLSDLGYENDRRVKIGKHVWIGLNCIILKGVEIGENSIVAAGSVVVNDAPANVLIGGNPARILKNLTS